MSNQPRYASPEVREIVGACADLVARTGGRTDFEVGYLHDNVPFEEAGWYAQATLKGGQRLIIDNQPDPSIACDLLARRILEGGVCRCGRHIVLRFRDCSSACCLWKRDGAKWVSQCGAGRSEPDPPSGRWAMSR